MIHRKHGTPVEVELIALAVRDGEGVITGYIGTHRDITERKRQEERIAEVREAERSRLARNLHDEALQELTGALVHADRGRSAGMGPEATGQLASTLKRSPSAQASTRLRPRAQSTRAPAAALDKTVDLNELVGAVGRMHHGAAPPT